MLHHRSVFSPSRNFGGTKPFKFARTKPITRSSSADAEVSSRMSESVPASCFHRAGHLSLLGFVAVIRKSGQDVLLQKTRSQEPSKIIPCCSQEGPIGVDLPRRNDAAKTAEDLGYRT